MNADDTVILANNPTDLQKLLNDLFEYCTKWGLKVNEEKTKVMIFIKRKPKQQVNSFTFNNRGLEIVEYYKYLGVIIKYNGNFS